MGALADIGSIGFGILFNVLQWGVVGLLVVALYFGVKKFNMWRKKRKSYTLDALIVKTDGTWLTDTLGNFEHNDKVDKLHFKKMGFTIPVIPNKFIRANQVILFMYAPKQFAIIPPNLWDKIDLKKFNIELVNLQMKNFVYLEQRAAVSRWAYIKDLMQRWAPWITLALIVACAGFIAWFLMKLGLNMFDQVTAARVAECKTLLSQTPIDIKNVVNP